MSGAADRLGWFGPLALLATLALSACDPLPTLDNVVRDDAAPSGGAAADAGDAGDATSAADTAQADGGGAAQVDPCVAAKSCACLTHEDCAAMDTGDKCLGGLFCDRTVTGHACRYNLAKRPHCSAVNDEDCVKNTCNAKTGACAMKPVAYTIETCTADKSYCYLRDYEEFPGGVTNDKCDDGNTCTGGDYCSTGYCVGVFNSCKCGQDADCKQHDSDNICAGKFVCKGGDCVVDKATVVSCKTVNDTECTRNVCDPKLGFCGMQVVPGVGVPCEDDDPCVAGGTCASGKCTGGKPACPCATDADCAVFAPQGTLVCVQQQCVPAPGG